MVAAHPHPWLLGGPWYRWPRPGLPADGRLSVPEIQKYAHAQFAKSFLAEPQKSLLWDPETDFVHEAGFLDPDASLTGRVGALVEGLKGWAGRKMQKDILFRKDLQNARMTPTGLLKLYLPVHERFYLVVCELHCDTAGFPSVAAEQVCSAGFVVRRRRTTIDGKDYGTFRKLADAVSQTRSHLADILGDSSVKPLVGRARAEAIDALKQAGGYETELATRQAVFDGASQNLDAWLQASGYSTSVERWLGLDTADPSAKAGIWRPVSAANADRLEEDGLQEHVVPMRRVFAALDDADHDARGRCLFFGVIPTASLQHDRAGDDRFDDRSVYEIRCFVRRRRGDCIRIPGFEGCRGEVIWSSATRPFMIASPMDPYGTANRPVTIRMPDLGVLKTQIATAPAGRFSSTAFVQPQQLVTNQQEMPFSKKAPGPASVCFFAIPLIMIVALFLLNLFLPIILFVFQLWWMLALKFCIPPSIAVDAGLAAALDAKPPGFDFEADFSVDVVMPGGQTEEMDQDEVAAALNPVLQTLGLNTGAMSMGDKVDFARASIKWPAGGRGIDFFDENFYPHVSPLWAPRPNVVLEVQP